MPTEFEWKIFPGFTTLGLLEKIQDLMKDVKCELEHFNDRIIFMSMYNDVAWWEKGNTETCEYNSKKIADYARKFQRGRWSFLGPGSEKKWCGTYSDKPDGSWDKTAHQMMMNFSESGHPIFRASSAFERGELRSKGHGEKSGPIPTNSNRETWCKTMSADSNNCRMTRCYPKYALTLVWRLSN